MQTPETLYEHEREYEQERGKPVPSLNHGITQSRLTVALSQFWSQYTTINELSLDLGDWRGTPDLCVYPRMQIDVTQDKTRMTEPPLLAVEIASPTQSQQELVDKIRAMLQAGIASCWLVQPAIRAVTVFSGDMQSETFTEDTITDSVTRDISVEIDDVFPE